MAGKVGIIGAMAVEVDHLISKLEDRTTTDVSGMTFYEGLLSGVPAVVVRCGIGKVNAAMCAQTLVGRFAATQVINTGVAGALDATLAIGDLVVSTDAVHHDMDVTGLGYLPGFVPELDDFRAERGKLSFEASGRLRTIALQAAAEVAPEASAIEGRIASGDLFVCEQEDRDRIIELFGASCCEMEGSAIAQVCWRNDVPFVIIRAISDNADDSSKVEYHEHEAEIAQHCAEIALRVVELLA